MISIGELSERTNVKVPTIRYYEQLGLVSPAARTSGNQRRYGLGELQRLSFIKHARELGLPLDAVRELLKLSGQPDVACESADEIASQHLKSVQKKISQLQKLENELKRIVNGCDGDKMKSCYVIEALANHELCLDEH